jgi:tRNA(Ser,Leu) C12 N-acetylase TAN1
MDWKILLGIPLALIIMYVLVRIVASATFISYWKTKKQFDRKENKNHERWN